MSNQPEALNTDKVLKGIRTILLNKQHVVQDAITSKQAYLNGFEDAIQDIEHMCEYKNWEYVQGD